MEIVQPYGATADDCALVEPIHVVVSVRVRPESIDQARALLDPKTASQTLDRIIERSRRRMWERFVDRQLRDGG